jgi:hypothetical protein
MRHVRKQSSGAEANIGLAEAAGRKLFSANHDDVVSGPMVEVYYRINARGRHDLSRFVRPMLAISFRLHTIRLCSEVASRLKTL